jgi:hypothetical protein
MSSIDQDSSAEPQVLGKIVRADGQIPWTGAVLATFRPNDHHISDGEIFEILTAADQDAATDLCAAKGVALPMYCVWKAKYQHLSLDGVRRLRRRERWRGRCLLGVLVVVAVLATGGIVAGLARSAYTNIAVATTELAPADRQAPVEYSPATTPVELPSTPINVEARRAGRVGGTSESTPAGFNQAGPPQPDRTVAPRPDAPPAITEPGYKIQVAAPASLQEGRRFLERLASAGYPAYLSRAIVSDIEVFRVRVGPFDTRSAAEEITSQLQREGYYGAWIAR